jgi:hypothetical protein
VADLPTTQHDPLSPSQRARLERLREPATPVAPKARLAEQIEAVCDDVERVQFLAISALDDEAMSWLLLCDRGWPRECPVDGFDLTPAFAWLAAWSELVSLPVEISTPLDKSKLRWIEERLTACEQPLVARLPEGLRQVIGAMDQTGRATLACVLQALVGLIDARSYTAAAASRRDELGARLAVLRREARELGIRAPLAPLDVRAWRATAAAVRTIRD